MFQSFPPPELLVLLVGIVATSSGCMCSVHHFGCGNMLLLARTAHGGIVLLHLQMTAQVKLATILISMMGVMDVGWFLPQKIMQLAHIAIFVWRIGKAIQGVHPRATKLPLLCPLSLQPCRKIDETVI